MTNYVITNKGREKLVKARAGDIVLPKIAKMAFGNGGVDGSGTPLQPSGADIILKNELLRKNIDGHVYPTQTSCRYSCTLINTDLVNVQLSELALVDEEGDLVAIRTFTNKQKDGDIEMIFEIEDIF